MHESKSKKTNRFSFIDFLWQLFKFLLVVLRFVLIMVFVVAFAIFSYFFVTCQYDQFKSNELRNAKPFDAKVWQEIDPRDKESGDHEKYLRCNMYRDLVKNHLYFDMTYEEVIMLLGEPDSVDYYVDPESKAIDYHVGECVAKCFFPTTGIDLYGLSLDFDRDHKLTGFGYNGAWKEKKNNPVKDAKDLFSCYRSGKCTRFFERPGFKVRGSERCQKHEVESKWGYKVW